jgi:hypothetical protein
MGESSKEGEKEEGFRIAIGVCIYSVDSLECVDAAGSGVFTSEMKTSVEVPGNSEDVEIIGSMPNEGSYDTDLCVTVGVVIDSDKNFDVGVCEKESGRKTRFDAPVGEGVVTIAGLGAMARCFTAWSCGVPGLLRGGDDGACEVDGEDDRVRVGRVSARSTIVLNESTSPSHAISLFSPAPAAMIVRDMIAYIFNRVFPAYIFGSPCSCGGIFCW